MIQGRRCCADNEEELIGTDDNGWSESEESSASQQPDASFHLMAKKHDPAATSWTDDKHSSYLNSIEATFVGSMHKQRFYAMDLKKELGSADNCKEDCVESRAKNVHGCCVSDPSEYFELLQGGHQKAYHRPQSLHHSLSASTAILDSPWIQHFKQKVTNIGVCLGPTPLEGTLDNKREHLLSFIMEQTNAGHNGKGMVEKMEKNRVIEADEVHAEGEGSEHIGMDSWAENSGMRQGFQLLHNRLKSQRQLCVIVSNRKRNATWLAKRLSDYEHGNANAFHIKKHKST